MKNFGTVIDNFDAVTKQYVDNKVPTDEHIKGIKVDNATLADTAKKVQNAFTYKAHNKAAGTVVPITYDGSKAASLDFSADDFAYDYSSGKDIKIKLADKDYATTAQVEEKYKKPDGGIPKSDLATSVQTSLDKADSALQSAPVTSVNGKTGAVQLEASDVDALPISTKYVVSVNGESGEVKNIAKTNSANTFTGDQTVTGNGSVSGNFTVGGNLTVNGTTTTVDSTTLQVKDKLIEVAHGNTTTLTTPAGLVAPKYDGTNSGALVFDSTGTAYVGDVTLKDGNIDVANSGLQPLATRTGLVGGNLVQYDSSALTLKDSGKKISDFATSVKVNGNTIAPSGGVVDIGTVLTDASAFATSAQGTKADNAMPKSGGTFTGEVKFGNTENFQGYYIKRMIGSLGIGTAYANLDSSYKDGTWHRMWRLRFPSGSNFWGKIKITLYGGYSSFNASGVMSKSITCNFNTSNIYNNVGCYDGLGVNVEQDFRISEAIWNATASAWEVLIWQKNLNGNNSPTIMLECWTTNNTNYINAFNGITAQPVELTQSTSYSAQKASSTGGTKTVTWATLPVYENPLGEEIATVDQIPDVSGKANLAGGNTFSGVQTINAPTDVEGSETTTLKAKTSNGGAIIFGKEGPNSGTMIRLDQSDGTCRLRFRSSKTAGAMVWEQPEQGAKLHVDLGKDGSDKHRVTFPSSAGTLALTSQVNAKYTKPSGGIPKTDLASDVQTSLGKADTALSTDGGTINKSKTIKMDASANSDGANLKWGTVNSKNPYIGYASDQVDGTFVVGSLLGTNYASGLAIGGGSGNLLWKGAKVATTSDIPDISGKQDALSTAQMAAANSGITAEKVTKYDGYENTINGKQAAITASNKLSASLVSGLATVATSGSYSDLRNIPTDIAKIGNLSNPNLLINPNFAINQRGQTSYTGKGYGVDRWKGYQLNAMVCTPNTNGVTLTAPESSTGTGAIYRQIIEPEQVASLAGKTITFSFMATNRGSAGIYMRCLTPASVGDTPNIKSGETKIVTKTITLAPDITELQFVFRKASGTLDVDIHWAKVEIGSVATEFSPPNIAEELPKCQRYYQKAKLQGCAHTASTTKNMYPLIPLPTTLRTKPTLAVTTYPSIRGEGSNYQSTNNDSITINSNESNGVVLAIVCAADRFTPNKVYSFANGECTLDAEI